MAKLPLRVLVLAGVLLLPMRAFGAHSNMRFGNSDYATYQDPVMVLNSYGVPLNPLQKDLRELKVVPAYIRSHSNLGAGGGSGGADLGLESNANAQGTWSENKASGGGAIVSWVQGLSAHWGYGLSVAYIRLSGKTFAFAEYDASHNLVLRHDADEKGTSIQATALAIYDPFTDPEGFRLPIYVGYGFLFQDQGADYSAPVSVRGNNTVRFTNKFNTLIPGLVAGASAQFNTGSFRWSPFFTLQFKNKSPAVSNKVTDETTGQVLSDSLFTNEDSFLPSGGIGFQYRPWGLGFVWVINIVALMGEDEDVGNTVFTLSKTFKF